MSNNDYNTATCCLLKNKYHKCSSKATKYACTHNLISEYWLIRVIDFLRVGHISAIIVNNVEEFYFQVLK